MMITIDEEMIAATLEHLQNDGERGVEGVVLWLSSGIGTDTKIAEVFRPEQYASRGNFRIPRQSMSALMRHLRSTGRSIAAQVHSHPEMAFHSSIDDEWAIVRHEGALSLVLPDFALRTTVNTFVEDTAVFELSRSNVWEEVLTEQIREKYRVYKTS
jgi:hypothetical protein